jgi:hypothetical protein
VIGDGLVSGAGHADGLHGVVLCLPPYACGHYLLLARDDARASAPARLLSALSR